MSDSSQAGLPPSTFWKSRGPVALLVLLFACLVVLVDPRGEFPLDDDWSFALSTWRSAEAGRFMLARFTGMALKTQIVWGALWSGLFGESFFVLRCSTIFLAAVSLPMFFAYARRMMRADRAMFVSLVLCFHPIFFWSSFTYMTHVPFFFCSLVSILLLERFSREQRRSLLFAAGGAAVAAYLLRQTGLGICVGALTAVIIAGKIGALRQWKLAAAVFASTIVIFVVLFVTTDLLIGNKEQMSVHAINWNRGVVATSVDQVSIGLITAARVGMNFFLFSLPLALPFALWGARFDKRLLLVFLLVLPFFLAPAGYLIGTGNALPRAARGDVLENIGVGPHTLRDTWSFRLDYPIAISREARAVFTYVVAISTSLFFASFIEAVRRKWGEFSPEMRTSTLLLTAASAGVTASAAAGLTYFDRYALDASWFLIPLVGTLFPWDHARARQVMAGTLIAGALFVVAGTAEYLDWNRARWHGFAYLRDRGVRLEQMDAGFEVNQYLLGGFSGSEHRGKAGMSVVDDEYILSFSPVEGYVVLAEFPYRGYFGLWRGSVLAARREVPFLVR